MKLIVNKLVNRDIKQLKNSLSATKVSRNDEKNELLWIFNLKKALSDEIKIIYWKQLYPSQTQ